MGRVVVRRGHQRAAVGEWIDPAAAVFYSQEIGATNFTVRRCTKEIRHGVRVQHQSPFWQCLDGPGSALEDDPASVNLVIHENLKGDATRAPSCPECVSPTVQQGISTEVRTQVTAGAKLNMPKMSRVRIDRSNQLIQEEEAGIIIQTTSVQEVPEGVRVHSIECRVQAR